MANTTLVQVRVDEALKDEVTNIYKHYGLDLPTAIRIFMKKTVAVNGLPFDLRDDTNKKNIWQYFGSGKNIEMNIPNEAENAIKEIKADIAAGKFYTDGIPEHIKRINGV